MHIMHINYVWTANQQVSNIKNNLKEFEDLDIWRRAFNARVYKYQYTILLQLPHKFLKNDNQFLKANDTFRPKMNIAIEFYAKFCTKMLSFMKNRSLSIRRHHGGLAAWRQRETTEGGWDVPDGY